MVGELAMERFRLLERLGAGGMGTVYRALDERLQREVAVKQIDGADSARILREAKAAARLNHPSIVTLYEFGAQGRRALLISELAKGEPLDVLAGDGAITDREVAWVGADVCSALAHAHERGVVHRDVKPQNIVADLDADPVRAKLMDFGIASIAGEAALTAPGEVVGTLAYMSPEQAEGEQATESSDVYSLGLTLYECWAGRNPVVGETPAATARRIGTRLPSLSKARPDLPEPLIAAIDDCLNPDPHKRPELDELAEALEWSGPELDDESLVPGSDEQRALRLPSLSAAGAVALGAIGLLLVALAGPVGAPGLALILGALTLPGVLAAATLPRAALPVLGPLFAGASLGSMAPAVFYRCSTGRERAILGAMSWFWLAASSLALGFGPSLPFADRATAGWSDSASAAASGVLGPLADPVSLGAAALFALAAWAIGPIVRSHVSLGLLAALLWGAAVDGALRLLDLSAVSPSPLLPAAAAIAAVIAASGAPRTQPSRLSAAAGSSA